MEGSLGLDSDHSAVLLVLSEKVIENEYKPSLWQIKPKPNQKISMKTKQELDVEVEKFRELLQDVTWNNTNTSKNNRN